MLRRVNGRGKELGQENLDLIKVEQLSDEELAKDRDGALALEKSGYEVSKDVYAHTPPAE